MPIADCGLPMERQEISFPSAIRNRQSAIPKDVSFRSGVRETAMAATTNKQRVLNQLFAGLGKGCKAAEAEPRPVLEQLIYAICREGVTREAAERAFRNLRERFFDWNEIRVSSTRELAEALEGLPDAEGRAQRLVDFLQEVFETTFSFDLEGLQKKGLKQAAKALQRYQAANDYAVAWVVQQSLGGHAIPLDAPSLRVLRRLGLLENEQGDLEALRASLEHQIPKARGAQFCDLISAVADEVCLEDEPNCSGCQLNALCPTAQDFKATAAANELPARAKPR
jgi:endonuclease-3